MKHGVAVIGCGKISDVHIPGWKRLAGVELLTVVDVDAERAESKAKEYGVRGFDSDYKKVLERKDIDIIDVCLPHYLHAPYSIEAMEAGKHVLVEKPIATTLRDAERMIAVAEKTKKKLMVAEQVRYSRTYEHLMDLITKGAIGEPFLITMRCEYDVDIAKRFRGPHTGWRNEAEKIGGGVLLESGIHVLAMSRYLMGDVESVMAVRGKQAGKDIPVEDTITVLFKFKNGVAGQGTFSWGAKMLSGNGVFCNTIYGSKGTTGTDPATGSTFLENKTEKSMWIEPSEGPFDAHWAEIKHFLECIDQDKQPLTDGLEETKTLRVILAAYKSAEEGRAVRPDELEAS